LKGVLVAAWAAGVLAAGTAGPSRGASVIAGGGQLGPEIVGRFIELAGGADAPVVVIPTAQEEGAIRDGWLARSVLARGGMKRLTALHTRDRKLADSAAFTAPLRAARGVWFEGGRQWRLADAYLGTRTERELRAVLRRGGVIGGSSAGATIQGSYLVRGAPEGNQIMMAAGHERGFGYVKEAAIDQHLIARRREKDLVAVVEAHPKLLGIGIDEGTAVVVERHRMRVAGRGKVAIYEAGKKYFFLKPGDEYDLKRRRVR
jgi:cyanophycinase